MNAQNSEALRLWLWLTQSEKAVNKAIRESDAPFLGLLGEALTREMRDAIDQAIAANPTPSGYVARLESHPALFAVYLAWHVMHGMGQGGKFSLYPHVRKALGMRDELGHGEREPLWRAFRRSLLNLGLEPSPRTSGPHFMADEYVRQAGVPLPFVDDLAERMLVFAKRVGLPDDDDPEGIATWQAALDTRLGPPFSQTARDALKLDRLGYYTRTFLRVYANGGQNVEAGNALEKAMAQAFDRSGATAIRRAVLPRVVFLDGCLGVFFPGGEEQEWSVKVDGATRMYRTEAEDRFIPLGKVLPGKVEAHCLSTGQKMQASLWEDEKSNRMLLFADTGRLAARGQLGQGEPLTLPPGGYSVLSRFAPADHEVVELSEDPRLFLFRLQLGPGEVGAICNGPARLEIQAESTPLITWKGDVQSSKEGVEFLFGTVGMEVQLPADWIGHGEYELTLNPGERGQSQVVPLDLDVEGRCTVSVSDLAALSGWKPGLMRVVSELRRTGEARILMRAASLFWLGLSEINRGLRFRCSEWPENLKLEVGENLERKGDDLAVKDASARGVRLVFGLSQARLQSLTWNVPGVFVEVESIAEGGISSRSRRALGSTETVSLISDKQIVVIASDPGYLRLGDWSQRVDFSRQPAKLLPASFLASRLTPQSSVLIYENESTGTSLDLLRLTQPHEASGFSAQYQGGQFVIRLHVSEPIDAIAVRALSLTSDDDDMFTLQANADELINTRFGQARLMVLDGSQGGYVAYVYINLDYWPAGAWLFNLDAQIKGIWGHVQNSRQDAFAAGLLWGEGGQPLLPREWLAQITELDDKSKCALLKRIHAALQGCYAQEAWLGISWLGDAWRALTQKWSGREGEALPTLADMVAMRPPEDASPSWLPQVAVSAELPGLFAQPADAYRVVNEKTHPLIRAMRAMASVSTEYPFVFGDLLHTSAAAGFRNFPAIARGAKPEGFRCDAYTAALINTDAPESHYRLSDDAFMPGPGDYLGPIHYRHALRALEDAYDRSLAGNDIHRGQALGLCQEFHRRHPTLDVRGTPGHFCACPPHLTPWPYPSDDGVSADDAQRFENLATMAHLIAWMAYVCRMEVREPGVLDDFLASFRDESATKASMTYLLQLGEGLFGFYLLLWELALKAELD